MTQRLRLLGAQDSYLLPQAVPQHMHARTESDYLELHLSPRPPLCRTASRCSDGLQASSPLTSGVPAKSSPGTQPRSSSAAASSSGGLSESTADTASAAAVSARMRHAVLLVRQCMDLCVSPGDLRFLAPETPPNRLGGSQLLRQRLDSAARDSRRSNCSAASGATSAESDQYHSQGQCPGSIIEGATVRRVDRASHKPYAGDDEPPTPRVTLQSLVVQQAAAPRHGPLSNNAILPLRLPSPPAGLSGRAHGKTLGVVTAARSASEPAGPRPAAAAASLHNVLDWRDALSGAPTRTPCVGTTDFSATAQTCAGLSADAHDAARNDQQSKTAALGVRLLIPHALCPAHSDRNTNLAGSRPLESMHPPLQHQAALTAAERCQSPSVTALKLEQERLIMCKMDEVLRQLQLTAAGASMCSHAQSAGAAAPQPWSAVLRHQAGKPGSRRSMAVQTVDWERGGRGTATTGEQRGRDRGSVHQRTVQRANSRCGQCC